MHDDTNLAALPPTELEELVSVPPYDLAFPERVPVIGLGPTGLSLLTTDQARLWVRGRLRRAESPS